ncbi:hypothetical protein [Methanimicrococcus hacksteinii]|nr:hypothetical protein [Methanimicrococcus sp. At1]
MSESYLIIHIGAVSKNRPALLKSVIPSKSYSRLLIPLPFSKAIPGF